MRICGVGDNVVDRYYNQKLMFPGGNAVNFAVHAQRSGMSAAYLGVIGTDSDGDLIRSSLKAEGVELKKLRVKDGPNAFATVHMDDDGNNRKWGLCEKGVSMFQLDSADFDYLAGFDLAHTGETSRLDGQLPEIRERVAISFDFSDRDLDYATSVLPFVKVAAFSRAGAKDTEIARVLDIAHSAGVELVTITQGARGATVSNGDEVFFVPAVAVDAVDTLGAGDAFVARLTCRVLSAIPLAEAGKDAAQYSALICGTRGAFGHARPITRDIPL